MFLYNHSVLINTLSYCYYYCKACSLFDVFSTTAATVFTLSLTVLRRLHLYRFFRSFLLIQPESSVTLRVVGPKLIQGCILCYVVSLENDAGHNVFGRGRGSEVLVPEEPLCWLHSVQIAIAHTRRHISRERILPGCTFGAGFTTKYTRKYIFSECYVLGTNRWTSIVCLLFIIFVLVCILKIATGIVSWQVSFQRRNRGSRTGGSASIFPHVSGLFPSEGPRSLRGTRKYFCPVCLTGA